MITICWFPHSPSWDIVDNSPSYSHLSQVGSAGVCVSAVAVHGKLAGEAGYRPLCAASASTAAAAVGHGSPSGASEVKGAHLENDQIMIYQYKICPFCNKLKAVMDYLGIPYQVTEVSRVHKDS